MYYIDMNYLDLESRNICGFLDYNLTDVIDSACKTLREAIEEIKYSIDEGFQIDGIIIYSIHDDMSNLQGKPIYTIARCSKEQGKRFEIEADEFYGDFVEDNEEDFEYEPF